MSSYKLTKAFHMHAGLTIWRIEVDAERQQLAVECRQADGSAPELSVYDFQGNILCKPYPLPAKEWTLAGIQDQHLICKQYGASTPITAGIMLIPFLAQGEPISFPAYYCLNRFAGFLQVRHQNFQTGFEEYLSLSDYTLKRTLDASIKPLDNGIVYPLQYRGKIPAFLAKLNPPEEIGISRAADKFIWSYYVKNDLDWTVKLLISSKYEMLAEFQLPENVALRAPTIYFQVDKQIFLLSDNKQEIVSYLV